MSFLQIMCIFTICLLKLWPNLYQAACILFESSYSMLLISRWLTQNGACFSKTANVKKKLYTKSLHRFKPFKTSVWTTDIDWTKRSKTPELQNIWRTYHTPKALRRGLNFRRNTKIHLVSLSNEFFSLITRCQGDCAGNAPAPDKGACDVH